MTSSGPVPPKATAEGLDDVLVVDSVTLLDASAQGGTVVCGSHGGRFAAAFAARLGVRGIVLNDAGVSKDGAGIAGLELLDAVAVPAVTASHRSACIGDARDCLEHGVLSYVNDTAKKLGCEPLMSVAEAARRLSTATLVPMTPPVIEEARHLLRDGSPPVWALDSASLAREEDAGGILLTGSHGALVGSRRESALRVDALAAVFNDAGRLAKPARCRLVALDVRGIAAATVAGDSARIGDGRSTYFDGVISKVNETAAALGAMTGATARSFVDVVLHAHGAGSAVGDGKAEL